MTTSKTLRIVHCVRAPSGGTFRHIQDLALAQQAGGHDVGLICDATPYGALEEAAINDLGGRLSLGLRRVPMERKISFSDLGATLDVLAHLRSVAVDVLHGHGAKGGAYARTIGTLLRLSGRSTIRIYCPHGGSLHYDPASREGRVYFRLERFLQRMTDGFVFVSGYEEDTFRAKVGDPTRPYRRVYNGLRPAEFEPIEPTPDMADVFYMGMMRDLKGPGVLIEALDILASRHGLAPSVRMVGEGPDRPAYEARVKDLGLDARVSFHDAMPTRRALSQGRILIVPSYAESMPYVVLEAIAARVPMIATRVGGIPEIFRERSGRLVTPGDPDGLADAIAWTIRNEAEARADALVFGRELAGTFSVERMATEIEAFYGDIADPPKKTAPEKSVLDPSGRLAPTRRI
ncbi:glycosyltransferase family 4 protein [Chthonobacter albigriseus]|uniref:glycosyltransferase family 4 protein n=1 Tax=Chthonobacter albigriseus TaxID=1683161 RepID=UPI0015EE52AB|nr:glycosyltransferase family 4 protein [Chthonobacter albigriseus]